MWKELVGGGVGSESSRPWGVCVCVCVCVCARGGGVCPEMGKGPVSVNREGSEAALPQGQVQP